MDILIFGGTGQIGIELTHLAWGKGVELHLPPRRQVDVVDELAVRKLIASRNWACVINAAAYTDVDAAESDVFNAWRVNALFPAVLASATAEADIPCIQVSTDYVFDGTNPAPYQPNDPVSPISVYGASKEGGEQAVRTANPRHVIVRTSWLASMHRSNFVKTILRLSKDHDVVRVVDDQKGCPTSAADLASALQAIALFHVRDVSAPRGTYHFVNEGVITRCGLATAILASAHRRGARPVLVEAVSTAVAYAAAARRPANSSLSTATLTSDFGIVPRPWPDAFEEILNALFTGKSAPAKLVT